MSEGPLVHIVDDDAAMRTALQQLLRNTGLTTRGYTSARAFLPHARSARPGCVICELRLPDMTGLDVLEHLVGAGVHLPVICMTAFADIPLAVRTIKAGAEEFVEKPFSAPAMLEAVRRALRIDEKRRMATANWQDLCRRMAGLTDKERESLAMILEGAPNKVIAGRLSITERAVEMRRASLMRKLHAGSFAELVRIATQYELVSETLRRDPA